MPANQTKAFIQALQTAERSGDVGPLVALFDDDAELESPARDMTRRGRDGAERFWSDYLSAFAEVHSEFTHVLDGGDRSATLEWRSEGRLAAGQPISYRGTSVLEFAGGRVSRFATYYDSAAFLPAGSKHAAAHHAAARNEAGGHPAGGVPS